MRALKTSRVRGELEHRIRDMAVGEHGYVVPWALTVDSEGTAYLDRSFPVSAEPGAAAMLGILRTASRPAAYSICTKGVDYDWSPKDLVAPASGEDIVKMRHIRIHGQGTLTWLLRKVRSGAMSTYQACRGY